MGTYSKREVEAIAATDTFNVIRVEKIIELKLEIWRFQVYHRKVN